jgi:hypothetical protein
MVLSGSDPRWQRDRAVDLVSWPRDPVEKLETRVTEVNLQGQSKTQHSKDLDCGRLHHTMIWYKNSPPAKSLPCRSAEPLLHSAKLSATRAVPGHSSVPDPHTVGYPSLSRAGHTTPEYPPLGCAARPTTTRIPTTSLHRTPDWSQSHSLLGYLPLPLNPLAFRLCWAPAMRGTTRTHPTHQALPGFSYVWNNWSPTLVGQVPSWCETAAPTSLPGILLPVWNWPQLYRLPK